MRGARSLVVVTGASRQRGRQGLEASGGGMRLVGPNSFGVAVPGTGAGGHIRRAPPFPGKTAWSAGIQCRRGRRCADAEQFAELTSNLFIASIELVRAHVSGTDMLLWWEADNTTELAVLYLESFGNPRRFARTARRVSAKIPILTVTPGDRLGQRAAASHTAAAGAPLITREALFDQAGIIATASFGELLDASVLVASQPVPAGSVVSIVSNGGGAGVLAADAYGEAA